MVEFHCYLTRFVVNWVVCILNLGSLNFFIVRSPYFNVWVTGSILISWRQAFALIDVYSQLPNLESLGKLKVPRINCRRVELSIHRDVVDVKSEGEQACHVLFFDH